MINFLFGDSLLFTLELEIQNFTRKIVGQHNTRLGDESIFDGLKSRIALIEG